MLKAKAKRIKAFRCVAKIQKSRVYCAQGGRKYFRHDRMDWYTNAMTIPKELDPNECKNIIRFLNGTDSPELNQYSYNSSFTYFTNLPISFQAEIERKQNPFTVTKLNTEHRGVFTYQPNNLNGYLIKMIIHILDVLIKKNILLIEIAGHRPLKKFHWIMMINEKTD